RQIEQRRNRVRWTHGAIRQHIGKLRMLWSNLPDLGEQLRRSRIAEVALREEQVLIVMLLPETRPLSQRYQRQVDHEGREVIEVTVEVFSSPARVLVMLMPNLARGPTCHRGHKDSIVIDQTQLPVFDDDVAAFQE